MKYFFIDPLGVETEFTNDVIRGANSVTEFCFDLESNVLPSDVSITVDNNQGKYSPDISLFSNYEVNRLIIKITDNSDNLVYTGVFVDPKYTLNSVKFKVSNVIYLILNESTSSFSMTGSPSEIVLKVLRDLSISDSLIDLDQFYRMNFIFNSLTDINTNYSNTGVDTTNNTVNFALLEAVRDSGNNKVFEFVSGKNVFKKDSYQKLTVAITSSTSYIDILKEVSRLSGMLLFTDKGVFTCRLYPFGAEYASSTAISNSTIVSRSVKFDKPVLWRRSKIIVPQGSGSTVVSRESSNLSLSDTNILSDLFAAKEEVVDGLSRKIYHADSTSATNGADSNLLLRSMPRYHITFKVSLGTTQGNNLLHNIKLFSLYSASFQDFVCRILPIKIKRMDDSVLITAITANETYVFTAARLTAITTYESANTNSSRYYLTDSDLVNSGITNIAPINFLHRGNRTSPALIRIDNKVYIINNTGYNLSLVYSYGASGNISATVNDQDFIEITTNENIFNIRVSYTLPDGSITESFERVNLLDISDSSNLLLRNYDFVLYEDDKGVLPYA